MMCTELETFTNTIGMKFFYIHPGTFIMGSPVHEKDRYHNETEHRVTLTNGFWISQLILTTNCDNIRAHCCINS